MVYYNASGGLYSRSSTIDANIWDTANALGIFSPAIILTLFAILAGARGVTLDAETAFTSIAILALVTHPANMVSLLILLLV